MSSYIGSLKGEELLISAHTPAGKQYIDRAIDEMIAGTGLNRDQAFDLIAQKGKVPVGALRAAYESASFSNPPDK